MKNINKMKKFFINTWILSFTIVISLYFFSYIWTYYLNDVSAKFLALEKSKNQYQIVNVGSSHGKYGIKYPLSVNGYNLGMDSQNFYYDYEILKKYSNKIKKESIIIIPISIFSFYNNDNMEIAINYINTLPKEKLVGLNLKPEEYFFNKYFSVTESFKRLKKVIKYIINSIIKMEFEKNLIKYPKNLSLKKKKEEAIETALRHLKNKEINNFEKLKEILNFCEENNFRPILITTPQTYLYNEQVGDKNYQERIYNNIKEIEKQMNKKYLYLDYSHDNRFENNLEYFSDDDHLNEKGAEYFTEILLNDIKNNGYEI